MNMDKCFIGLASILMIGLIYVISIYNKAIRLKNIIPGNRSNIEILRKKKEYLITKMGKIVDLYSLHEKGTTEKVSFYFGRGEPSKGQPIVERLAYLIMEFPELKTDGLYNQLLKTGRCRNRHCQQTRRIQY